MEQWLQEVEENSKVASTRVRGGESTRCPANKRAPGGRRAGVMKRERVKRVGVVKSAFDDDPLLEVRPIDSVSMEHRDGRVCEWRDNFRGRSGWVNIGKFFNTWCVQCNGLDEKYGKVRCRRIGDRWFVYDDHWNSSFPLMFEAVSGEEAIRFINWYVTTENRRDKSQHKYAMAASIEGLDWLASR